MLLKGNPTKAHRRRREPTEVYYPGPPLAGSQSCNEPLPSISQNAARDQIDLIKGNF